MVTSLVTDVTVGRSLLATEDVAQDKAGEPVGINEG
jgi:hypothetical protein